MACTWRVAGFLLLFIYAMINMNIVSWGTREVANVDDADVDVANRVKQPNIWTSFIHEVYTRCQLAASSPATQTVCIELTR